MVIRGRKRTDVLFLILMLLFFQVHSGLQEDASYKDIPVGVILDTGSWVGKTVHSCITMALSDFYMLNNHYKTRIVLHNRGTHGEALHALSAALDLLEKPKVQAIIGSESATEAKFLAVLGDEARVPILSLSPTPCNKYTYFLQITQDETTQFKAIAAMAESFKWKNVILICEGTDNGRDMAAFMTHALQNKSISITYTSLISTSASSELLQNELLKLSTLQTKIYIIHTFHRLASHILINAKYLGMMDAGYKWIVTSKTMNFKNFMDDEVIESMEGVVGFKSYIPKSRDLQRFTSRRRKVYQANNSEIKLKGINAYAIWAYDAVRALAMAVERVQTSEKVLESNIKDLEATGLTQRGKALLNQMLRISFHGLGGFFQLTNGKITTDVLEIINMIDKEERRVGFWTMDAAFTRKIGNLNSISNDSLKPLIWPGGIMTSPAQRMLQTSSKTLIIGVSVHCRKGELFKVYYDIQTNSTAVSGLCAEVFSTAFSALGHNVTPKFIPFSGSYIELIYQVHIGKFDAAVGDITITAERSEYVDFTLPFTDLGLGTLVRNTDTSMWIFMKPISSDLWIVSACFFILMGFVIWIL